MMEVNMINLIQYFGRNLKDDSYYGYHFFSLKYEETSAQNLLYSSIFEAK